MATKTPAKKTPATKKKREGQEKLEVLNDLYLFQRGLMKVSRTGARFTIAVAKNLRVLNAEIEDMEKVIESSDEIKEYQKRVDAINKEHALKDGEGEFILRDTVIQGEPAKTYRIPGKGDKTSKYEKELQKLKDSVAQSFDEKTKKMIANPDGKKNQEIVDEHQEKVDQYNEFLKTEPCHWEIPRMVDENDVPDAAAPMMDAIIFMIKEK